MRTRSAWQTVEVARPGSETNDYLSAEALHGCKTIFKGEYFYFGGDPIRNSQQGTQNDQAIKKLIDCYFDFVGTLSSNYSNCRMIWPCWPYCRYRINFITDQFWFAPAYCPNIQNLVVRISIEALASNTVCSNTVLMLSNLLQKIENVWFKWI